MRILEFVKKYGTLKHVPRTGWLIRGINRGNAETVSDHVLRTTMISSIISNLMIMDGEKLEKEKVMETAILHDLSESLLMDIDRSVAESFGKEIKIKAERMAEETLLNTLPERIRKRFNDLLNDFHDERTLEAKIVRLADRIETLIQGSEYVKSGYRASSLMDIYSDVEDLKDLGSLSVRRFIDEVKKELTASGRT